MKITKQNLFNLKPTEIRINIYADEIQPIEDKRTKKLWFYIGILIENIDKNPLNDIVDNRYKGNFDKTSPYYKKNDRILHWKELNDAETKHICKRLFNYFFNNQKGKLYFYMLGINDSNLIENFGKKDKFNNKYNRFFRTAISYRLKKFFKNYEKIIIENIYHEIGQQRNHLYFPWHSIFKINKEKSKFQKEIIFINHKIKFLPKNHRKNKLSNFIQLCDCLLGATKDVFHGGVKRKEKIELIKLFLLKPINKIIDGNGFSRKTYPHFLFRFFPKYKRTKKLLKNKSHPENNFYYVRRKIFEEELYGLQKLPFYD